MDDRYELIVDMELSVSIDRAGSRGLGPRALLPAGTIVRVLGDAAGTRHVQTMRIQPIYRGAETYLVPDALRASGQHRGYSLIVRSEAFTRFFRPWDELAQTLDEEGWHLSMVELLGRRNARRTALRGLLLGTAVGDAVALPFEGLGPRRIAKLWRGPLKHRLLPLGVGMISDDTDHAVIVAQSLIESGGDSLVFSRVVARRFRWWIASLPAGVGWATLRAGLKLWLGFGTQRSGVFSAGNGPAMRVAVIGAAFCADHERLTELVGVATRMTHTDPRALTGALAVARISAWIFREKPRVRPSASLLVEMLLSCGADPEWTRAVKAMELAIDEESSVQAFAHTLGLANGVSGYIYHTVPVAICAWHRHFGDYRETIESIVRLGGDTDTVAAIAGALAGAVSGDEGIPLVWRHGLMDWPNSKTRMASLADFLAEEQPFRRTLSQECNIQTDDEVEGGVPDPSPKLPPRGVMAPHWLASLLRNMIFASVVLLHGFRRLLPPYG